MPSRKRKLSGTSEPAPTPLPKKQKSETDDACAAFLEDCDSEDSDLNVQGSRLTKRKPPRTMSRRSAPKDNKRRTGKVVRWKRGYGFIAPSDGGEELFVHCEDIISQPE